MLANIHRQKSSDDLGRLWAIMDAFAAIAAERAVVGSCSREPVMSGG